jgi:hypothetical protein
MERPFCTKHIKPNRIIRTPFWPVIHFLFDFGLRSGHDAWRSARLFVVSNGHCRRTVFLVFFSEVLQ